MNENLLQYLLESATGLTLLYLFYWLVLRRETSFQFNRFYLMASLFLSLGVPLSNLPGIAFWPQEEPTAVMEPVAMDYVAMAPTQVVAAPVETFDYWNLLYVAYAIGTLFFATSFLVQVFHLRRFAKRAGVAFVLPNKIPVILTQGQFPTFSFWRWVFFDNSQSLSEEETQRILQHEQVHIDQRHTLDVLLVSLAGIVFWFNPLLLFYKKAVEQTHEFIADAQVAKVAGSGAYSSLLIKQVFRNADFPLGSYFFLNKSLTLTRIKMMKKLHQSPKLSRLLLVVPLLALFLVAVAAMRPVNDTVFGPEEEDTRIGDAPAEFPEAYGTYSDYVNQKLQLPEIVFRKAKKEGEVYMLMEYEYEVNKEGKVSFLKVLNLKTEPNDPEVQAEVKKLYVDMVNTMPKWKPALVNGSPVAVTKKGGLSVAYSAKLGYENYLKHEQSVREQRAQTTPAEFPGGREALNAYVKSAFVMPEVAFKKRKSQKNFVKATATVEIGVQPDGTPIYRKATDLAVSPNDDEVEAAVQQQLVKLVTAMPKWAPAQKDGKAVSSLETISISSTAGDFLNYQSYLESRQQKTTVSSKAKALQNPGTKPAAYPGGKEAMYHHLNSRFLTPEVVFTLDQGEKGIMFSRIIKAEILLNEKGEVTSVKPLEVRTMPGNSPAINKAVEKEFLRVANLMPRWTPAYANGKPVASKEIISYSTGTLLWNDTYAKVREQEKKRAGKPYTPPKPDPSPTVTPEGDKIFIAVEKMPEFPGGGQAAMFKYFNEKVQYPEDAKKAKITGTMVASFVVNKDGKVSDVHLLKGVYPSMDKAFLKLLQDMPTWTPGSQNGKEVAVKYTVPFRVVLNKETSNPTTTTNNSNNEPQEDKVYIAVEQMPEFPGGQAAMFKYLSETFRIPLADMRNGTEGTIILNFIVQKDGAVVKPEVVKGVSPTMDQEALRVISSMPAWKPGMQNGKSVDVKYTVPYRVTVKTKTIPAPENIP